MDRTKLWGLLLPLAGLTGLAMGLATAPPAEAALPELGPGLWRAELGDFSHLVSAVAFAPDDIWAAGDGVVRFDGSGWKQTINGQRPFFRAIHGLSRNALWAAGEIEQSSCDAYGVMYRFDGVSWYPETVETHLPLDDIHMVSATDGWAVGGREHAVILRYDGRAWRLQPAPEVAGLRAVQALAPDEVWAVGDRGAIVHFDGHSWRAVSGPRFANLTDLHLMDRDYGWAVGVDRSMPTGVVLAYRAGQWTLDSFEELPRLYAVRMLAPAVSLAVGGAGAILFNDGSSWREVGRTYPGGYFPYRAGRHQALAGADATAVVSDKPAPDRSGTVAGPRTDGALAGAGPSGGAWPYDTDQALHSLVMLPDRETLIAVGYAGQVVRIEDSLKWTELHSGHQLLAIDMLDTDYGWIVGSGGRPLRWQDGAWTVPPAPSSARWLRDVEVLARDDVWALGRRGTVLHWDGTTWTDLPRFTWLDLLTVDFSGPDDGWAIANAFADEDNPWASAQESIIFHWDGRAWRQVMRLCHSGLGDIAALGPGDVWFSDPYRPQVLHFDGTGWRWVPIWAHLRADGPTGGIQRLAVGADGSVWGSSYALAETEYGSHYWSRPTLVRLEAGLWRAQEPLPDMVYVRALSGATADGVWGMTWDGRLLHLGREQVTQVLAWGQSAAGLAVVAGPDGVPNAWMIGFPSTVLHYRAASAASPGPLASATPALPPPRFQPTPTPYSVFTREEALAQTARLVDPEDTGELRLDSLRLETVATWWRKRYADYLDYSGEGGWYSRGNGTLDPCARGADLPVWVAEFSRSPLCPAHALVALDATGRGAWRLTCYPRRTARLFLPLTFRPRDGGISEPTPTPVQRSRDLTPEPVLDTQGVCPTTTPWPEEPGGPYPGPGE